jgi:probable metal-binding protein
MENINHIHEVLELIHTSTKSFTKESLVCEIEGLFGAEARFTTCGDHLFGIDGVIPFLLERNKINIDGGKIIPLTPPCSN